jgi:hypothetical protein
MPEKLRRDRRVEEFGDRRENLGNKNSGAQGPKLGSNAVAVAVVLMVIVAVVLVVLVVLAYRDGSSVSESSPLKRSGKFLI